jgi:hypothetical protein
VLVYTADGSYWTLAFSSGFDGPPLAPGTYSSNAGDTSGAWMGASADSRGCGTSAWTFTIREVVFGPHQYLERFDASFEFHCEGLDPATPGVTCESSTHPPLPRWSLGWRGLDLAARHPNRVNTLVAHEPPALNLLPDGAGWRAAFQAVVATYRRDGVGPAMQQFISTAVRTGGPQHAEESGPSNQQASPPEMPDLSQLPPEALEGMARMQANSQYFLTHLLPTTIEHTPDLAGLQAASSRVVVGVGEASEGQMPHLAALAIAERIGATPVSFPGDHQGFSTHPEPFAETIHQALQRG